MRVRHAPQEAGSVEYSQVGVWNEVYFDLFKEKSSFHNKQWFKIQSMTNFLNCLSKLLKLIT
jgi:hypothetical protein